MIGNLSDREHTGPSLLKTDASLLLTPKSRSAQVLTGLTLLGGIGVGLYFLFQETIGGIPLVTKIFHRERADGVDQRLQDFLDNWQANGSFPLKVIFGNRSLAQQQSLYAEGRTTPGPNAGKAGFPPLGQTVTNANSNVNSAHGHGGAIDVLPTDAAGLSAVEDYTGNEGMFQEIQRRAEGMGLVSGASWQDYGHVEVPDWNSLPVIT